MCVIASLLYRTDDGVCISEHIIATSNVVYKTEKTDTTQAYSVFTLTRVNHLFFQSSNKIHASLSMYLSLLPLLRNWSMQQLTCQDNSTE